MYHSEDGVKLGADLDDFKDELLHLLNPTLNDFW